MLNKNCPGNESLTIALMVFENTLANKLKTASGMYGNPI